MVATIHLGLRVASDSTERLSEVGGGLCIGATAPMHQTDLESLTCCVDAVVGFSKQLHTM